MDQLDDRHREYIAGLPEQVELEVEGLGRVLFCHGSPRSDEEMILRTTPGRVAAGDARGGGGGRRRLRPHAHAVRPARRTRWRVVNAGSVGLAYGAPGAHWLSLGPDVVHRQTPYDNEAFADHVKALEWSIADRFAEENIRSFPSEEEVLGVLRATGR